MSEDRLGSILVQSPVCTRAPHLLRSQAPLLQSLSFRAVGRRRIFVQTDDGDVLGVDLDRADRAGSLKRAVQAALNVPTEQAELVFGGYVLGDDLSEIQREAPVVLLKKGLRRSVSSPCLSPSDNGGAGISALQSQLPVVKGPRFGYNDSSPWNIPSLTSGSERGEIELVGRHGALECHPEVIAMWKGALEALQAGLAPQPASGGLGGAYYVFDAAGNKTAIVKPTDEEPLAPNNPNGYVGRRLGQPGLKRTIRVGEAGVREVAAYLLDHGGFAAVPPTALVRARHPVFHVNQPEHQFPRGKMSSLSPLGRTVPESPCSSSSLEGGLSMLTRGTGEGACPRQGTSPSKPAPSKLCSMQRFVVHDSDASEIGTSRFPVSAVHRIGILDVRLFNTDRHSGNILVRRVRVPAIDAPGGSFCEGQSPSGLQSALAPPFSPSSTSLGFCMDEQVELVPIDHGFCLPETLEAAYFEWLHWPQASVPFSQEELQYIADLDPGLDAARLRSQLPMLREGCLRVLLLSTLLLQCCAAAGLTLADVGGFMTRELHRGEESMSEMDEACVEALRRVEELKRARCGGGRGAVSGWQSYLEGMGGGGSTAVEEATSCTPPSLFDALTQHGHGATMGGEKIAGTGAVGTAQSLEKVQSILSREGCPMGLATATCSWEPLSEAPEVEEEGGESSGGGDGSTQFEFELDLEDFGGLSSSPEEMERRVETREEESDEEEVEEEEDFGSEESDHVGWCPSFKQNRGKGCSSFSSSRFASSSGASQAKQLFLQSSTASFSTSTPLGFGSPFCAPPVLSTTSVPSSELALPSIGGGALVGACDDSPLGLGVTHTFSSGVGADHLRPQKEGIQGAFPLHFSSATQSVPTATAPSTSPVDIQMANRRLGSSSINSVATKSACAASHHGSVQGVDPKHLSELCLGQADSNSGECYSKNGGYLSDNSSSYSARGSAKSLSHLGSNSFSGFSRSAAASAGFANPLSFFSCRSFLHREKAWTSARNEEGVGQLPGGNTLALGDMDGHEWELFVEIYLELLDELVDRKRREKNSGGRGSGVRFGTSCQF